METIRFWNRSKKREEIEAVYGEQLIRWLYDTTPGQVLTERIFTQPLLSRIYGAYQSSTLSRRKIQRFIKDFQILMDEYESGPFRSFNEFFVRKFKPGARHIVEDPGKMPAFAEGRYLAFEKVHPDQSFPVKGGWLSPEEMLNSHDKALPFKNGPLFIARLCPTDYHRFHFPDEGRVLDSYRVHGKFHSVNPKALRYRGDILVTNERQVSILETKNFGRLAYVEIGALCVGRIVQSFEGTEFKRGQEKGYFLFGGSTVILMGEPGAWKPENDLLEKTQQHMETFVKLGDVIAHKTASHS